MATDKYSVSDVVRVCTTIIQSVESQSGCVYPDSDLRVLQIDFDTDFNEYYVVYRDGPDGGRVTCSLTSFAELVLLRHP